MQMKRVLTCDERDINIIAYDPTLSPEAKIELAKERGFNVTEILNVGLRAGLSLREAKKILG